MHVHVACLYMHKQKNLLKQWIIVISSANITHEYEFDHDLSDSGFGFERKDCILHSIIHIFVVWPCSTRVT